jgi:hypothetical protein
MPQITTSGFNRQLSPSELVRYHAVAEKLGDVTLRVMSVLPDGPNVWISRTAADDEGLRAFREATEDTRVFPATPTSGDLPPVSEVSGIAQGANELTTSTH